MQRRLAGRSRPPESVLQTWLVTSRSGARWLRITTVPRASSTWSTVTGAKWRIANALGAHEDELVITRNATEACHNLIRQYRGLGQGDAVLLADIDYPGFKTHMHWLRDGRGVRVVEIALPARANRAQILGLYLRGFEENPDLKLMLITHVSNQHGLVVPVAEIVAEARRRGIDVICDAAQSWGLLDFPITDLGADWVALNLHKWIGAPVGTGALYMRRGTLGKIAAYPGEEDPDDTKVAARIGRGVLDGHRLIPTRRQADD